jgi:Predicted aminomethyltransferase related to GcvT
MKAALLSDRGVVKVAGDEARSFLHGLVSADMLELGPGAARFCALLTPQGKIIADFIATEAPAKDGGGFFLDVAGERVKALVDKLNLYKLRSRVMVEDLSEVLGVLATWDGTGATSVGLAYPDPRLPALGTASCSHHIGLPMRRQVSAPRSWTKASTRRTGSRSAFRAAASISATAMPSRMRRTWISSVASISRRAAMSARKSSHVWSIAASPARAPLRSAMTAPGPANRRDDHGRRTASRDDGLGGRRPWACAVAP